LSYSDIKEEYDYLNVRLNITEYLEGPSLLMFSSKVPFLVDTETWNTNSIKRQSTEIVSTDLSMKENLYEIPCTFFV